MRTVLRIENQLRCMEGLLLRYFPIGWPWWGIVIGRDMEGGERDVIIEPKGASNTCPVTLLHIAAPKVYAIETGNLLSQSRDFAKSAGGLIHSTMAMCEVGCLLYGRSGKLSHHEWTFNTI